MIIILSNGSSAYFAISIAGFYIDLLFLWRVLSGFDWLLFGLFSWEKE